MTRTLYSYLVMIFSNEDTPIEDFLVILKRLPEVLEDTVLPIWDRFGIFISLTTN